MKIFLIFLMLTLFPDAATADRSGELQKKVDESKKELEEVHGEIRSRKRDISEAVKKETQILGQLDAIESDLENSREKISSVSRKIAEQKREIKKIRGDADLLKQKIDEQKGRFEKRAVALYKYGKTGPAGILFSSDSYMTLFQRKRFLQLILEQDIKEAEEYAKNMEAFRNEGARLGKGHLRLADLKRELVSHTGTLAESRKKKKRLLASVKSSRELHEASLRELKISSLKLEKMIDSLLASLDLEEEADEKERFTYHKGLMEMPANGKIVGFFGEQVDPRFNTLINNNGIEIALSEGTDIKAIFGGRVIYADRFKGYGKVIIIDHGEGYYSLSAHASRLLKKVGQTALKGEVVGLAGDTGSLSGTHLYFEIRYKGKTIDPLEWLKKP